MREGDFSYRIPVKGTECGAELGGSFNTMTENLGRLIVVAKKKGKAGIGTLGRPRRAESAFPQGRAVH